MKETLHPGKVAQTFLEFAASISGIPVALRPEHPVWLSEVDKVLKSAAGGDHQATPASLRRIKLKIPKTVVVKKAFNPFVRADVCVVVNYINDLREDYFIDSADLIGTFRTRPHMRDYFLAKIDSATYYDVDKMSRREYPFGPVENIHLLAEEITDWCNLLLGYHCAVWILRECFNDESAVDTTHQFLDDAKEAVDMLEHMWGTPPSTRVEEWISRTVESIVSSPVAKDGPFSFFFFHPETERDMDSLKSAWRDIASTYEQYDSIIEELIARVAIHNIDVKRRYIDIVEYQSWLLKNNLENTIQSQTLYVNPQLSSENSPAARQYNARLLKKAKNSVRQPLVGIHKDVFQLADIAARGDAYITIYINKEVGTFSESNFGSLPHFVLEKLTPETLLSMTIQKREPGPVERLSGKPYKSLGAAVFNSLAGQWVHLDEDEVKVGHTVNPETDEKMPVEPGLIFNTIPEMFPQNPLS